MFERILRFNARFRPDGLAISTPVGNASFATLDRDVDRMASRLRERAASGSLVAVQAANPGLHWVVLMALARLGCATASLPLVGERSEAELLAVIAPDLLVTDRDIPPEAPRAFHMSTEWIEETFKAPVEPCPDYAFAPDEPVRVVLSSGTTGRPKKMTMTRRAVDARVMVAGQWVTAGSPVHVALGMDTETAFRVTFASWSRLAPVIYPAKGFAWADFLRSNPLGSLVLAPIQLDALLRTLPPDFMRQAFDVFVVSGGLSRRLYEATCTRLSPNVHVAYGSTEAGFVATAAPGRAVGPQAAYLVSYHADVEIVDRQDAPVAPGGQGRIRVRTAEMVDGYADEAETGRHFGDGWFYPGDLGSLGADGALMLEGRETEVFDVGGLRVAPAAIEEVLLACEGVRDAAAFAVPIDGIDWPHAAVVCEPGCDLEAVRLRLARERPQLPIPLVMVEEIPRSDRGKPRRDLLARQVIVAAAKPQAGRQPGSEAAS